MSKKSGSDKIHRGHKYKRWQNAVLKQGNYRCSQCGNISELTADHILPIVSHPELCYDVDNGRILCNKCRVRDMLGSWQSGRLKH